MLSPRLLATGLLVSASGLASPAADPLRAQSVPGASERCASLARLARRDLVIESAELTEAGAAAGSPGAGDRVLPAHCLVKATIDPRTDAGGRAFGIGFEL